MTARLSQSAPTRDDDLVKHLPDDLFEDGPSVEEALNAASVPAITMGYKKNMVCKAKSTLLSSVAF